MKTRRVDALDQSKRTPRDRNVSPGTCIYCAQRPAVTRDHVPPRGIFPDPKPSDLVTVPACEPCNRHFKLDDEYFRTFVVTNGYTDATARDLWNKKIIGSRGAEPVRRLLRRSLKSVQVKTPAGLYLGQASVAALQGDRVARVAARIALGLLWHHHRTRPGPEVAIHAGLVRDFTGMEEILENCRYRAIGGRIFSYAGGVTVEDPEQSVWFFEAYGTVRFVVFLTRSRPEADWLFEVPRSALVPTPSIITN